VASLSRSTLVRLVLFVCLFVFGNTFCDVGTRDHTGKETYSAALDSQDTDVTHGEWPTQPAVAAILHSRDTHISRAEWQNVAILNFVTPTTLSTARGVVAFRLPLSVFVCARSPMSAKCSPRAPPPRPEFV
jgi:hypothetical protein